MRKTRKKAWWVLVIPFLIGLFLGVTSTIIATRVMEPDPAPITVPKPTDIQRKTPQLKVVQPVIPKPQPVKTPKKLPPVSRNMPANEIIINGYVHEICKRYNVSPQLIKSIIYHESRYKPSARVGNCVGLMQVSTRWHRDRAKRLGVTNLHEPYGNILVGVDYISELLDEHKDPELVLMLYNMKHDTAKALYKRGEISNYARSVLKRSKEVY